jgi:molybdenum cofactor cytidylyltransferase
MGASKLLLPLQGKPIIEHVLAAYQRANVSGTIVVVRADDAELAEKCRALGATLVVPREPPPQMKDSVQAALAHIASNFHPTDRDAWLLAPADVPSLSADVIVRLLGAAAPERAIITPVHRGQRGHPSLFPWPLAGDVARLGVEEGINSLQSRSLVLELECGENCLAKDVDTPEDYRQLAAELTSQSDAT